MRPSRREFLRRSAATGALLSVPYVWTSRVAQAQQAGHRLKLAAIGVGGSRGAYSQGGAIAMRASRYADMAAVCDVDEVHMEEFNKKFGGKLKQHKDYRELLEKERPDVVTIGTPDHWHVPIAIAALKSGCDVYCEKPLTLTIEEGFRIRDAVKETGRVFQVGTQQRSEHDLRFLKAIALVKSGRLGKKVDAHLAIGGAPVGGPFPTVPPIEGLDWNMWVGPAQTAKYSPERRQRFRWFYDYSGGKMTDWGAHHIDIAQWALGHDNTGPIKVNGIGKFTPIVPEHFDWIAYLDGRATLPNGYHTPSEFDINMEYADGSVINVCHEYDAKDGRTKFGNGILFVGDEGRIFVNRERLSGKPIEDMTDADNKWLDEQVVEVYGGKQPGNHMGNFFECIQSRDKPISDVGSHHRTMTSCHLCNITLMLGRELRWDPDAEKFVGDEQATMLMTRPRRTEYSWEKTAHA
jgi:myo-inositol 2-dehydrogenase/D-chiro-inositol 1-dehydrogenase